MSKKDKKSDGKALRQQMLLQQRQRLQKQQQQKQIQEKLLADQSSPLIQFGLLDGYEYFLVQLAQSGIPQGNVFEFAAQMTLKFEKGRKKREKELQSVQKFNQEVIKQEKDQLERGKKRPRGSPQLKKQSLLPFKGQLTETQKNILTAPQKANKGKVIEVSTAKKEAEDQQT